MYICIRSICGAFFQQQKQFSMPVKRSIVMDLDTFFVSCNVF